MGFQGNDLNRRPQTAKHPCGVGESEVEPQPPSADGGILLFLKKFELKNFPLVCEKWNKKLHLNKK